MADTFHRYPGAQPFRDDEFSRRTFFGREQASVALTDQILANRLVVVYAKSGLGKTSLLNAGVAPRLREADSLPLFVRVNDVQSGPLTSVLEGIRAEAERQQVEYVHGESGSLWSFFKSVEFWRGDLLLTPVLILDQFEELFTLQPEEERERFLSELGYLVRGIPPPSLPQTDSTLSNASPSVRLVLSLREDFLGLLEEASDRIPQIMDHRFRLAPLTCEMAAKAITGPAAINDPSIPTKPFRLEPEFVTSILDYLTKSVAGTRGSGSRYVEPFHLQLICQRVEKVVEVKQSVSREEIVLGSKDIGGESALAQTLATFYTDAIQSLPSRQLRGAVRLLCEQFLISPEGRRLSLEERELQRQLKLPHETLSQLVERRLLRTDRRSDSIYYELSHDALVQPVLENRRTQALLVGWVAVLAGSIASFVGALLIPSTVAFWFSESNTRDLESYFVIVLLLGIALVVGAFGIVWIRAGIRRRKRYRRHAASEVIQPLPTLLPLKDRILGWVMLVVGSTFLAFWGLVLLAMLVIVATLISTHGKFPHWLMWARNQDLLDEWQHMRDHPLAEIPWILLEIPTISVVAWMSLRRGARKLWPNEFAGRLKISPVPGLDHAPSLVSVFLKVLAGGIAFLVAALGFFTLGMCISVWHGNVPYRFLQSIWSLDVLDACNTLYRRHYWDLDLVLVVIFFVLAFAMSIRFFHAAFQDTRSMLRHRRFARPMWTKAAAAAMCGVLFISSLLYWAWSRSLAAHRQQSPPTTSNLRSVEPESVWAVGKSGSILYTQDGGKSWSAQTSSISTQLAAVVFATPQSGWAVGNDATILHTEDGGGSWKMQTNGTGWILSVAFATPQSGWVVGRGGTIWHTEDGGTWNPQSSGTSANLSSVAFATPQSGWAVGENGTILHTEDSGGKWKPQSSGTNANLRSVAFAAPQSGWAVGDDGTILHTEDGSSWSPQTSGTLRELFGIAFVTPQSGWAVGEKGTILHTEDSGGTWMRQRSGTGASVVQVAFATPQSGWAVGDDGTVLHTEDAGRTWTTQSSGTHVHLKSVAVATFRGSIGVGFRAEPDWAVAGGSFAGGGVTITHVTPDGSAEKAGLKAGDTIVSVNGKRVNTGDELVAEISVLKPGTDAKLGYVRKGKDRTANVVIADRSKLFASRTAP
jgi:photosystem II stability/assembly factor-like uncharacterized protein